MKRNWNSSEKKGLFDIYNEIWKRSSSFDICNESGEDMLLKEIAKKMEDKQVPHERSTLPADMDIQDLTQELVASCDEVVYLSEADGTVAGVIQRELLEYLGAHQEKGTFAKLLDNVQDGIIAVDASGRIFYLNKAYTDILNVKPHKIVGKYIQKIEPESLMTKVLETHRAEEDASKKIASVNKYVSTRIMPMFSGDVFVGAVSIFQDVTEMHALNKEVRKMSGIVGEYSKRLENLETLRGMGVLTQDKAYLNLLDQAAVVAQTDVPVLIRGENGVGKEVLANYIHRCSERKNAPMITVNCAAIPGELLESELFGYEEGAFTGAAKGGRKGKFELADKGTIFLDEIGDMPLVMQSKLLRVLQYGEIEKLGRQKSLHVDVRVIAATNQPLEQMITAKLFRQDLFFRLNIFTLAIPSLRDRPEDILLLADHFLQHFNRKYGKNMHLSSETCLQLQKQLWPGNVRELQGCIERAVILENEELLTAEMIPHAPQTKRHLEKAVPEGSLRELLWDYEEQLLLQAVQGSEGNRNQAMKKLGLSRRTFYRKCSEHGVLKEKQQ